MPSLKPIRAIFAVALTLSATSQLLAPASAQTFISRIDQGKKECGGKHGTFNQDTPSSDTYTCTYASDRKVDHCVASTGKCTTSDLPAPKSAAATTPPKQKSLLGTGDVTKAALKKICAQDKDWSFVEERSSSAFSCMDGHAGVAINCKKEKDCAESHSQVHPH